MRGLTDFPTGVSGLPTNFGDSICDGEFPEGQRSRTSVTP